MVNSNDKDKLAEQLANSEAPQLDELSSDQLDNVQGGAWYAKLDDIEGGSNATESGGAISGLKSEDLPVKSKSAQESALGIAIITANQRSK